MLPPNLAQWSDEVFSAGSLYGVEPVLIFAHLQVETEGGESKLLDKPGPEGRGDRGHGHGLMQIDDRTWKTWIAKVDVNGKPLWMNPAENIAKGTSIIASNLAAFGHEMIQAIAAYNAGPRRVREAVQDITVSLVGGKAPREAVLAACDGVTANGDYVTRVLTEIARLNPLVEAAS